MQTYSIAKSDVGICSMGVLNSAKIIKSVVPVIMAGILGIYGLIFVVILNGKIKDGYKEQNGYKHLGSGLCCGLCFLGVRLWR